MSPAFDVLCHNLIDKPLLLLKLTNQKYPSFISFCVCSTSQLVRSNLLSSRQELEGVKEEWMELQVFG